MFKRAIKSWLIRLYPNSSLAAYDRYERTLASLGARHVEPSAIVCTDDVPGAPSERLLDVSLDAIRAARTLEISIFDDRESLHPRWYKIWPGDHYRLLAGFVKTLNPSVVIEVGTDRGMGTLSLMQEMKQGVVHTFDIVPWDSIGETWFKPSDFESGRVVQHIADLADWEKMRQHKALFESADILFVDAPKDGVFEPAFVRNLGRLTTKRELLVVFDDTRVMNMLALWRNIERPKIDLVSFGHWSGTGLVDWNG